MVQRNVEIIDHDIPMVTSLDLEDSNRCVETIGAEQMTLYRFDNLRMRIGTEAIETLNPANVIDPTLVRVTFAPEKTRGATVFADAAQPNFGSLDRGTVEDVARVKLIGSHQ